MFHAQPMGLGMEQLVCFIYSGTFSSIREIV